MSTVSKQKEKKQIFTPSYDWVTLVVWWKVLDGSQERLAPPWGTGTMFLICHLLSEFKDLRQLSRGNS